MPQAPRYLREKMKEYFDDPISDTGPIKYLKEQGYELTAEFCWKPPEHIKSPSDMSEKEWACAAFLILEWDYNGLETEK